MADSEAPTGMLMASAVLGWAYSICWTISAYPFIISNIRRRSTRGLSIDFCLLNLLGMAAYAIYNAALVYSATVRQQFAERNPNSPAPLVQVNDVAYAVHGMVLAGIIYSQFYRRLWGWKSYQPREPRHSTWCVITSAGCFIAAIFGALGAALLPDSGPWSWLDLVYLVGGIKTALTLVKYAPQAWLNYKRRSTEGLLLLPFALDLAGSVLSLLQLVIDAAHSGNNTASESNPVKLMLACVSMAFDLTFLFQRYVLYPSRRGGEASLRKDEGSDRRLLVEEP